MTRTLVFFILWLLCSLTPVFADDNFHAYELHRNIESLLSILPSQVKVGIVVQSMQTGQILYQKNADALLVPGSNIKLFTAFTALDKLGPDFKFQTQFLSDGAEIQNGILNGNLYVKFNGDPDLELNDLDQMVASLSTLGIRAFTGDIIIDDSNYDGLTTPPGMSDEDSHYCYGAPVEAFILNRNCVNVRVVPTKLYGQTARLEFPKQNTLPIKNNIVTSKSRHTHCGIHYHEGNTGEHELSGCVKSHRPIALSIPLYTSKRFEEVLIKSLLLRHRITLLRNEPNMNKNMDLKILVTHESIPLKELIVDMLKNSHNLIANTIYKQIGLAYSHSVGNWNTGSKAVHDILLLKHGIDTHQMVMVDGAGLSHYNLVSALQISQLLYTAYRNQLFNENLIDALPIGGRSGTLKHRMRTSDLIGRVKAKTGTMRGVVSLSGYIQTQTHNTLSFSIIINNFHGSAHRYRLIEDQICKILNRG